MYSYDRRLVASLQKRAVNVVTPLYGYTSENNAYEVDDYPYGFKLRTKAKYWVETDPKRGSRWVFQTLNPKNGRWNTPKKNTYDLLGGEMFLDEKGHVNFWGLNEYASPDEMDRWLDAFPQSKNPLLKAWAKKKHAMLMDMYEGKLVMTINKQPVPVTQQKKDQWLDEAEGWWLIVQRLK